MNRWLEPAACRYSFDSVIPLRDHRLHDNSPCASRYDSCRESIGQASELTDDAEEAILGGAILLIYTPARRACSTGVPGIYKHDWDAGLLSLVRKETLELSEGPVGVPCPLALANRCPRWSHAA